MTNIIYVSARLGHLNVESKMLVKNTCTYKEILFRLLVEIRLVLKTDTFKHTRGIRRCISLFYYVFIDLAVWPDMYRKGENSTSIE